MRCCSRAVLCSVLLAAACRRPEHKPSDNWHGDPGVDTQPASMTLDGSSGAKLPRTSFRLDPMRGAHVAAESSVAQEESLYLAAARSGQAWAQTKIGVAYLQMGDDARNLGEALRWLRAAADQDDIEALRVMSELSAQGRGMEQSDKDAYKFMRRAADLGSAEAQYELADMLANGRGMPRDLEAALVWGRKAAGQGLTQAQFSVGRALLESMDRERQEEGLDFLRRAAEGGNIPSVLLLASAHAFGRFGLPKDESRAEAILLPWANNGNLDCQLVLAALYAHGEAFATRRDEAEQWLSRTPQAGHPATLKVLYDRLESQGR